MRIRLVVTGRDYHLAAQLPAELELPEASTVQDALKVIELKLEGSASKLPPSCLIAVSGAHLGTIATCPAEVLKPGDELAVIAPVAGG